MLGYLSLDIMCSSKLTVFLELCSRKTVRFSKQIMPADKYSSIFSRQMKAIVYITSFEPEICSIAKKMILRKNDRPETFLALKKGHEAEKKLLCTDKIQKKCCLRARPVSLIDLIHDGRHVGFAIIMQISYSLLRGQTTQIREVITNILATQMICFTFIECLSPK